MRVHIIGAGLAGLLAGNLLKRSGHDVRIVEMQKTIPNNHSAVLRFRSPIIGDTLGIPFKSVMMTKATVPAYNPVADAIAYAYKCSGVYRNDRSLPIGVVREERWIAPHDLIPRLSVRLTSDEIVLDCKISIKDHFKAIPETPIISTIPMPVLAKQLGYNHLPEFQSVSGFNIKARVKNCEAYVSLYVPDPLYDFNRISITGDELIVEYANKLPRIADDEKVKSDLQIAAMLLGLDPDDLYNWQESAMLLGLDPDDLYNWQVKAQQYAKIQPIETGARKRFIAWATDNHNIFSFGRFAVWKPGLLLDDLIEDIRKIERWLEGDRYSMRDAR
jgi:hypothetical protein